MIMTKTNHWVMGLPPSPQARLRLFGFPYAGGGASIFRLWPDGLPASIEVCPIQLPGRENRLREPPYIHMEPLVRALCQALQPYLNMPYAFFGHSMGALVSFELARTLVCQNGLGPVHLFVSGHAAPQIPPTTLCIHQLPEPEFIAELGRLNGTPSKVLQNVELMEFFLPALRADLAVNETYTYTSATRLDCPISAYGGLQDCVVGADGLAAWRDQTRGTFKLCMFSGDHFFLHGSRLTLLQAIANDLEQSIARMNKNRFL